LRKHALIKIVLLSVAAAAAGCGRGAPSPGSGQAQGSGHDAGAGRAAGHAAAQVPTGTPVVLVSIDTLRSDHLPVYGYKGVETPAVDALRRDSILFERAYTQVPETFPSHSSLLTGLLPAAAGVRDNVGYGLDSDHLPYLPRLLRQQGYATGAAISAFVLRGETGLARGFDLYDDHINSRVGRGLGGLRRAGSETLQALLPWLRSVAGKRPFFLFLHLYEPHAPYTPPPPFAGRFANNYDDTIAAADAVLGALVAELKRLAVYDRAIFILLSDHGEGLGEHGEDGHGIFLYRNDLQVPLLLKLPRSERAGEAVPTPVRLLDVSPTLLALLGFEAPAALAGRSLLAPLPDSGPPPVYAEAYAPRIHYGWSELTSLIRGNLHYVEGPDPELFDLAADPAERRSVLADERRSYFELRQALAPWKAPLQPPRAVDQETRQKLAALGYVGTAAADLGGPLPDPKKMIGTLAVFQDGLREFNRSQTDRAIADLSRAVKENPKLVDAWDYLGRSFQRQHRFDEALAAYKEAMKLSGGLPEVALATAILLVQVGRPEEALLVLHHQIEKSPEDHRLAFLEVRVLLSLGRVAEARPRAEAMLRQLPANADAVYQMGSVEMAERDLPAAERDLRRALAISPVHPAALSDLAVLLAAEGRMAEAQALLEKLVALRPDDREAAANLERVRKMSHG
jgi:choline-sulfatase